MEAQHSISPLSLQNLLRDSFFLTLFMMIIIIIINAHNH